MTIGQHIICKDKREFEIVKAMGAGGQGSLYIVNTLHPPKEQYILKIINEKKPLLRARKIANIRKLKDERPLLLNSLKTKKFNVALPISLYEENGEFGYIMEICSGVDINHMMLEHAFDKMKTDDRIRIVRLIAESADWLQSNGFCYQDFSHKNFMYDANSEKCIAVIDCDNLAPSSSVKSGDAAFAGGTGFYMAPEVAFGQCKPSIESDNYALATLFFKIMTGTTDSPYHGKELYAKRPHPANMRDAAVYTLDDPADYGYKWLTFIFDPADPVNSLDPKMFKNPETKARKSLLIKNWKAVPEHMKELFFRAFRDPLSADARKNRPNARHWYRACASGAVKHSTVKTTGSGNSVKKELVSDEKGKMTAYLPGGKCVTVSERCLVKTTRERPFGVIERDGSGYVFISDSVYALECVKCGIKQQVRRGDHIALDNNTEISILMNPNEKLTVKIT